MRERMAKHRSNPTCAGCHSMIDQAGFALENFDAVGQWRSADYNGKKIDASGVLLDGTNVDGPAALRTALLLQKEQFVKAVTGKLLMYGIGRELHYSDAPAVRSVVHAAAADQYRWSSVILAIVKSTPFQFRITRS